MLHGGALPSSMSSEKSWSTAFWMPEDNPFCSDLIQSSVSDRIHYEAALSNPPQFPVSAAAKYSR